MPINCLESSVYHLKKVSGEIVIRKLCEFDNMQNDISQFKTNCRVSVLREICEKGVIISQNSRNLSFKSVSGILSRGRQFFIANHTSS